MPRSQSHAFQAMSRTPAGSTGNSESGSRSGRIALERCGATDLFHDYILSPYEPLVPPDGKLRSVNVLYESFACAGVEARGARLVERLRAEFGWFRTVWGVKQDAQTGAVRGWELYFYDFERANADLSLARIREILHPTVRLEAVDEWEIPWHMFSVELSPEDLLHGGSVPAHVYVDMRSYELRGTELELENIYTFHEPRTEIRDVLRRMRSALHLPAEGPELGQLMPPWLFRCRRLCVAHKRHTDALYFSGIDTQAFLRFLESRHWPRTIQELVRSEEEGFAHLLWDVGVDFRREREGLRVLKAGIYGTF